MLTQANESLLNLIGSITALSLLAMGSLIFILRLSKAPQAEYWVGIVFMLAAIPLIYLLFQVKGADRSTLYWVQIALMLVFILVEFLLDYVFHIPFRQTRWMVIVYATLFFAACGGMIGLAALSGKIWTIVSVGLFFILLFLAFYTERGVKEIM